MSQTSRHDLKAALSNVVLWAWHSVRLAMEAHGAPMEAASCFRRRQEGEGRIDKIDQPDGPWAALFDGFGLGPVERRLVMLLLAREVDGQLGAALEALHGHGSAWFTVRDIGAVLMSEAGVSGHLAHLDFLSDKTRLRRLRLVDTSETDTPRLDTALRLARPLVDRMLGLEASASYRVVAGHGIEAPTPSWTWLVEPHGATHPLGELLTRHQGVVVAPIGGHAPSMEWRWAATEALWRGLPILFEDPRAALHEPTMALSLVRAVGDAAMAFVVSPVPWPACLDGLVTRRGSPRGE